MHPILARWWFAAVVAVVAVLLGPVAHAATLACTVGAKTLSLTISAGNANRMAAWAAAVYATAPDGTPNPDPVLAALAGTLQGLKDNVVGWEKAQAAAAVATPAPIN